MTLDYRWSTFDDLDGHTLYALLRLRQEVFCVEQDCAYLDLDGRDQAAHHLCVWCGDDLVAYLRLLPPGVAYEGEASIGRVVTSAALRGRGQGRPLMREGIRRSEALFPGVPIKISAQAHLHDYYASLGFEQCGDGYDEDGIPHLPMRRST